MSVWTTKSLGSDKEYIVLRHSIRGVNVTINGVKFRSGYGVVEKNSKVYYALKKMPVLRNCQELPLIHLKNLQCITRSSDIRTIFGQEVYAYYMVELEAKLAQQKEVVKEEKETAHIESAKCAFRSPQSNELCLHDALGVSPSGYCKRHILEEPKLESLGIKVPRFITKNEIPEVRAKIIKQLAKLKTSNSNGENIGNEEQEASTNE